MPIPPLLPCFLASSLPRVIPFFLFYLLWSNFYRFSCPFISFIFFSHFSFLSSFLTCRQRHLRPSPAHTLLTQLQGHFCTITSETVLLLPSVHLWLLLQVRIKRRQRIIFCYQEFFFVFCPLSVCISLSLFLSLVPSFLPSLLLSHLMSIIFSLSLPRAHSFLPHSEHNSDSV